MLLEEQKAMLTIGLFAALADGSKADAEREEIRRMADSLANGADGADRADLSRLVQDVLLKRVQLQSAASALTPMLSVTKAADGLRSCGKCSARNAATMSLATRTVPGKSVSGKMAANSSPP